ncbi:MAG: hypothetical protein NTZ17_03660 [Phycisphaerae bacterium]|nr:hypothetical protein [Phycisphaerae bacterium]
MIENVQKAEDLRVLSRRKKQPNDFQTIAKPLRAEYEKEGWQIQRENKSSLRVCRPKTKQVLLEDRVWSVLYLMGFTHLSGQGGARLALDAKKADGPTNQVDIVGLDSEIALAIECSSHSRCAAKKYF